MTYYKLFFYIVVTYSCYAMSFFCILNCAILCGIFRTFYTLLNYDLFHYSTLYNIQVTL